MHKVVPPQDRDRQSMAFALYMDKEAVFAPLPQFCTEENPARFEPFTYRSFYLSGETPYQVAAKEKAERRERDSSSSSSSTSSSSRL